MPNQQIIDDPFSSEFMETANNVMQTIHVSAASFRRRRVKQDKFVLHPELKKRLIKLISTDVPEQVKVIAQQIIDLKHVPAFNKYCNYLGLSQADYSKISYLDAERKNRLEGEIGIQHIIKPGTQAVFHYRRGYLSEGNTDGHYTRTLNLTARHLGGEVYPIQRVETENREFTITTINYRNAERVENTHLCSYAFKNTFLEPDSSPLRIRNTIIAGSSGFVIDQIGFQNTGTYNLLNVSFNKTETKVKEVWNYKKRYHTSVGKIVRRLFGDTYSDRDITAFAEAYATLITVSNPLYDFSIIEGEAIKDAYYYENYLAQSGPLGNSCMRHRQCQSYFDIYTKFPSKVKMAVIKRGNKIAARSIMWNIEGKFMFDRIYFTTNETHNLLKNTLEAAGYSTLYCTRETYAIQIDIDGIDKFPYLDTLCNYDLEAGVLTNDHVHGPRYEFRNTTGDYCSYETESNDDEDLYACACCDRDVLYDDTTYIAVGLHRDQRACDNCAVYSEVNEEYFTTADNAILDYLDRPMLSSQGVLLASGKWAHESDYDLRQFENGFGFFILEEDYYLTDGTSFYSDRDPNRPEGLYDHQEIARRDAERLAQIMREARDLQESFTTQETTQIAYLPNSIAVSSAVSSAVYNSEGSLSVGTTLSSNTSNLGITYYSGIFQTTSSNYSGTFSMNDDSIEENQPEEMVQDTSEEHLI